MAEYFSIEDPRDLDGEPEREPEQLRRQAPPAQPRPQNRRR